MMRFAPRFFFPELLLGLVLVFAAAPSSGDDLFVVSDHELRRYGVVGGGGGSAPYVVIGTVTPELTAMAFGPEGSLYGVDRDGRLHQIDPETAEVVRTWNGFFGTSSGFTVDLAVSSDGIVNLLDRERRLLMRLDPTLNLPQGTGEFWTFEAHDAFGDPDQLVSLADQGEDLIGFTFHQSEPGGAFRGRTVSVGRETGAFFTLDEGERGSPYAASFDSDGDLWIVNSCGIIAPPTCFLIAVDPVTFDRVEDKPVYQFLGILPIFAVRRQAGDGACVADDETLCLLDGRFAVTATAVLGVDTFIPGQVLPGAGDEAGLFWLFSESNWELAAKMLNGCEINGHFWFLLAGTTDLLLELNVTDTQTGADRVYFQAAGQNREAIIDLESFVCGS